MSKIMIPGSDISFTLNKNYESSKVSKFLDQVISDEISLQKTRENLDSILESLGIEIEEADLQKLKESDLVRAQYANEPVPEAGGGAVALVFVVVACADGSVY